MARYDQAIRALRNLDAVRFHLPLGVANAFLASSNPFVRSIVTVSIVPTLCPLLRLSTPVAALTDALGPHSAVMERAGIATYEAVALHVLSATRSHARVGPPRKDSSDQQQHPTIASSTVTPPLSAAHPLPEPASVDESMKVVLTEASTDESDNESSLTTSSSGSEESSSALGDTSNATTGNIAAPRHLHSPSAPLLTRAGSGSLSTARSQLSVPGAPAVATPAAASGRPAPLSLTFPQPTLERRPWAAPLGGTILAALQTLAEKRSTGTSAGTAVPAEGGEKARAPCSLVTTVVNAHARRQALQRWVREPHNWPNPLGGLPWRILHMGVVQVRACSGRAQPPNTGRLPPPPPPIPPPTGPVGTTPVAPAMPPPSSRRRRPRLLARGSSCTPAAVMQSPPSLPQAQQQLAMQASSDPHGLIPSVRGSIAGINGGAPPGTPALPPPLVKQQSSSVSVPSVGVAQHGAKVPPLTSRQSSGLVRGCSTGRRYSVATTAAAPGGVPAIYCFLCGGDPVRLQRMAEQMLAFCSSEPLALRLSASPAACAPQLTRLVAACRVPTGIRGGVIVGIPPCDHAIAECVRVAMLLAACFLQVSLADQEALASSSASHERKCTTGSPAKGDTNGKPASTTGSPLLGSVRPPLMTLAMGTPPGSPTLVPRHRLSPSLRRGVSDVSRAGSTAPTGCSSRLRTHAFTDMHGDEQPPVSTARAILPLPVLPAALHLDAGLHVDGSLAWLLWRHPTRRHRHHGRHVMLRSLRAASTAPKHWRSGSARGSAAGEPGGLSVRVCSIRLLPALQPPSPSAAAAATAAAEPARAIVIPDLADMPSSSATGLSLLVPPLSPVAPSAHDVTSARVVLPPPSPSASGAAVSSLAGTPRLLPHSCSFGSLQGCPSTRSLASRASALSHSSSERSLVRSRTQLHRGASAALLPAPLREGAKGGGSPCADSPTQVFFERVGVMASYGTVPPSRLTVPPDASTLPPRPPASPLVIPPRPPPSAPAMASSAVGAETAGSSITTVNATAPTSAPTPASPSASTGGSETPIASAVDGGGIPDGPEADATPPGRVSRHANPVTSPPTTLTADTAAPSPAALSSPQSKPRCSPPCLTRRHTTMGLQPPPATASISAGGATVARALKHSPLRLSTRGSKEVDGENGWDEEGKEALAV